MLRFDTLKIAFPRLYLTSKDYPGFAKFPSQKHVGRWNYYLPNPCPGIISILIGDTEIVIEFSAKILKADYPQLLSIATIQQALANIIAASPLAFKVPEVLRLARVLKAHQTHDFTLSQPFAAYAAPLAGLYVNREYRLVEYKDETVTFQQNATGPGREYLRIYDKAKEYALPRNAGYRKTLTAAERKTVAAYYAGKTRVETQFNSKRKLRQHFPDIHPDLLLIDLLQSTSNPLATQFAEITKETYAAIETPAAAKSLSYADSLGYGDAQQFAFLKEHGYDLEKVDARLKALSVPKSTQCRERKKYTALLASYLAHETDSPGVELLHELKTALTSPAITIAALVSKMEPVTAVSKMEPPQQSPAMPSITIATMVSKMEPSTSLTESDEDAAFFALLDSFDYDEDEDNADYYTAQRI